MSDKTGNHEKGILARTATYTTKKARRAQTKLKQRVGKGDETKDEVFDEFVTNFNKQQAAAARLHTELKNYLRCITAMQLAASNFGEAFKDVYEEDWTCRDKVLDLFQESDSNWITLNKRMTEEVLEPLTSYQKPFIDVKNKIHKRSRKLVDYDHTRHIVDTLRAKGATKSSDAKKLNIAEDDYQKARDIFIDLTSDLYEELPALFDSRIGFYVSCFQSIFTLEEVFHREASKIEHQLNDLMDQLIKDFSAGTYSTRKPFSAGIETTSNSSEKVDEQENGSENSGLAQFYDVAVPSEVNPHDDSIDSIDSARSKQSNDEALDKHLDNTNNETIIEDTQKVQPVRPAPLPPFNKRKSATEIATESTSITPIEPAVDVEEDKVVDLYKVQNNESTDNLTNDTETEDEPPIKQSTLSDESLDSNKDSPSSPSQVTRGDQEMTSSTDGVVSSVIAYKNIPSADNANRCNLVVPASLYKVVTTHKYSPEDEDELSFEKDEIIHVIPFDDPEEQDDGWLMGVVDSSGLTGVFPENFSKKLT